VDGERTPRDVFDRAESDRVDTGAAAFATAIAGWAALEAVRQVAPRRGATKTWDVTSGNPRPSHAAMNGETVPINEPFSNGCEWPGDEGGDPDTTCGCNCSTEVIISY
jgi:hypothetical protein